MKFVLRFALFASVLFVPAWLVAHAWQHALAAVAVRLVAPAGTEIQVQELELFYPVDLAVFVALCAASAWAPWRGRWRAAALGAPVVVAAELVALAVTLAVLLAASAPGAPPAQGAFAARLADGLIRVSGLAVAALTWFALLGRQRLPGGAPPRRGTRPRATAGAAAIVGALALLAAPRSALAHGVGSGQMELSVDGAELTGVWSLDLRDARLALGLDPAVTGEAGFADLKPHEAQLRAVLLRSLSLAANGRPVTPALTAAPLAYDAKWNTVGLHLVAHCPVVPDTLTLGANLLYDTIPTYRTYFSVQDSRVTSVGVFRASARTATFGIRQFHAGEVIGEFVQDGVNHIWTGLDHMLFLLALLLPAPLLRVAHGWAPRPRLVPSAREVLKVVTAFTLAHSITLSLAFFGIVRLPAQWIEVGIAVSVFAAAWNNLRPFLPGRAWIMAFGFGLVHGLGFAGALGNLMLPRNARVLSLAAFNGGVEVGQLGVVLAVLPFLYLASRRDWYPRLVMGAGSLGIAWMAAVWVLERAFNLSLFARG